MATSQATGPCCVEGALVGFWLRSWPVFNFSPHCIGIRACTPLGSALAGPPVSPGFQPLFVPFPRGVTVVTCYPRLSERVEMPRNRFAPFGEAAFRFVRGSASRCWLLFELVRSFSEICIKPIQPPPSLVKQMLLKGAGYVVSGQ